jgi:hypothetical protein
MSTTTQTTQSILDAMLAQYETNTNSYAKEDANVYDLKNYFTTHIGDKVKSATKTIRILPTKDGSTPFVELHGHKVQVDGEWKTLVCLKNNGIEADCPFCEANDALRATGKEADKELAKKYNSRKMYVVKVIDRDNEADGPKFWRFNHDYRKQGVLDKIFGVLQATGKDITDATTGRDLLIVISRDQNNRPTIQSISHKDPSPLSADAELAQSWLDDARTWNKVYATKSYEYLEIIVKGGVPTYDKVAKKFVDKNQVVATDATSSLDEELSLGVSNVKSNVTAAASTTVVPTAVEVSPEEGDDDLPF